MPEITDAELDENIDRLKKRLFYGKDETDLDQLGESLGAYEALRACRRELAPAIEDNIRLIAEVSACQRMRQRSKAKDAVVEAARKLEYEIDQTFDVDDGHPNYPFGREWRDVRLALAALDKRTDDAE